MAGIKDYLLGMEEEKEREEWERAVEEMYADYMMGKFIEQPIEEIREVASYMRRHQIEYLLFLDRMAAPDGDCMELRNDEGCKRDFLRYEMTGKVGNKHIETVKNSILNFIDRNYIDLLFE